MRRFYFFFPARPLHSRNPFEIIANVTVTLPLDSCDSAGASRNLKESEPLGARRVLHHNLSLARPLHLLNAIRVIAWPRFGYAKFYSCSHDAVIFPLAPVTVATEINCMKNYTKIVFSIVAAVICTAAFAADRPNCKKTGKNCPMNDNKACNCGKSCDC